MVWSDALRSIRLAALAVGLTSPAAVAHDWYPRLCCHDNDCAPVEHAEALPDGAWRLTSRVGTTDVPADFPRRASPDHRMHICMTRFAHLDGLRPICLFVPRPDMRAAF